MLQERSEMEDKAQDGALDSSVDTQIKRVDFSYGSKKPDVSDEKSLDSYGDK